MRRDKAVFLDIERAASLAVEFSKGVDRDAFLSDLKTQSAIIHQLLVLGEAVKQLSSEFRDAHPEVPWALAAGLRDRLIHGYHDVDLDIVWRTVQRDVPELLAQLKPLLQGSDDVS